MIIKDDVGWDEEIKREKKYILRKERKDALWVNIYRLLLDRETITLTMILMGIN